MNLAPPKNPPLRACPQCFKPDPYCLCSEVSNHSVRSKAEVLILQHPQEPDHLLGTARLAGWALGRSATLKIGLSWPNFKKALGREADPKRWAVLHLGSGLKGKARPHPGLYFVDKKGTPTLPPSQIEGIIVLDGTWSQAKTLWWRNPWLLKLRRAILVPKAPSLYGKLRKEPRRECLSTLETIAHTLEYLGAISAPEGQKLADLFQSLLRKAQAAQGERP